jgi:hypothetical protein
MPSIVESRPFEADLGPTTAIGFFFIADPVEDSFVRCTLNVLGLEDVSFEARMPGVWSGRRDSNPRRPAWEYERRL